MPVDYRWGFIAVVLIKDYRGSGQGESFCPGGEFLCTRHYSVTAGNDIGDVTLNHHIGRYADAFKDASLWEPKAVTSGGLCYVGPLCIWQSGLFWV